MKLAGQTLGVSAFMVFLLATNASAQVSLLFDVGRVDTGGNINSITWDAQDVADAIDLNTGLGTGVSLTVTSPTGFNELGPNDSGTNAPGAPANAYFSAETTNDNLFGHITNFNAPSPRPLVEYTIAGLSAGTPYEFTFFASRLGATDNREAEYALDGLGSGSTFLNSAGNESEVAQMSMTPTAGGVITLTIQPGPNNNNGSGFFYLGGISIVEVPEPASLSLLVACSLLVLRRR